MGHEHACDQPYWDQSSRVELQLTARLRRINHGIQTCYEFAEDVGGLDRSVYFGRPKDLYHLARLSCWFRAAAACVPRLSLAAPQDHFQGHLANVYPELLVRDEPGLLQA